MIKSTSPYLSYGQVVTSPINQRNKQQSAKKLQGNHVKEMDTPARDATAYDLLNEKNDQRSCYSMKRAIDIKMAHDQCKLTIYTNPALNHKRVKTKYDAIDNHAKNSGQIVQKRTASDSLLVNENGDNSVHVSKKLKRRIVPAMYEKNIDASQLSSPDSNGLRRNAQQDTFLKINNHYVKVTKLNGNRYAIGATLHHPRLLLRLSNNTFSLETVRERLANLMDVGLSGRKRKNAIDVLKEQDGFTEDSAKALLAEYRFPTGGLYSDYTFALDIEQWGKIPVWAKRFKKDSPYNANKSHINETISIPNPLFPEHKITFNLGEMLGSGVFGTVFVDADNTNYVIKRYFKRMDELLSNAMKEAETFQRYYGEGSAQVLKDDKGYDYLRMYRVPGQLLSALPDNSLPLDAVERFVDMLEKLNHVGIIHHDMHSSNVLWDAESNMFYPIDISDIKETYFTMSTNAKTDINDSAQLDWDIIVEEIKERMIKS